MTEYAMARNDRTTLYELHAPGCRHLGQRHMEWMADLSGDSAAATATSFEDSNEDCVVVVANCARRL